MLCTLSEGINEVMFQSCPVQEYREASEPEYVKRQRKFAKNPLPHGQCIWDGGPSVGALRKSLRMIFARTPSPRR